FWQHPQGYGGSARLNSYIGNHSIKFGGEYRVDRGKGVGFEPHTFNIKQSLTANVNSGANLNTSGCEWLTFLLGYIDTSSAAVTSLLASKGEKQLFNGAWIFTSANNRHAWNRKVLNLLPRLGGAYRIDDKSVVRFGWGRYLSPSAKVRDPLGDFVNQYAGYS